MLNMHGVFVLSQQNKASHELNVPRHKVHNVMYELDPAGLENHALAKNAALVKGKFTTRGTNWVHSFDGHAKLMGFQRDTFLFTIYGCIYTASRKIMWLRTWISHSNPKLIVNGILIISTTQKPLRQ
jgi:hypothetical protein